MASYDAAAQSKKKGKEPELAISKRGKLIFEDDFAGKELEWVVNAGDWKIVKQSLVLKCRDTDQTYMSVHRPFAAMSNVIFQLKVMVPVRGYLTISPGKSDASSPTARLRPKEYSMSITYNPENERPVDLAVSSFPYPKPAWVTMTYEMLDRRCALTVNAKTIMYEIALPESLPKDKFVISAVRDLGSVYAVDDVKVWEALPKDEEDDKDKKKKK